MRSVLDTTKCFSDKKRSPLEQSLMLEFFTPSEVKKGTARALKKGYLGCVAVGSDDSHLIVIRLEPNKNIHECSIASASTYIQGGITFASSLRTFIIGRMAKRVILVQIKDEVLKNREEFTAFAAELGDTKLVPKVFNLIDSLISVDQAAHPGKIWELAENDALLQSLANAWTLREDALGEWTERKLDVYSQIDFVWRLFVCYQARRAQHPRMLEAIERVLCMNNLFDSTYNPLFIRPPLGANNAEAVVAGAKWLVNNSKVPSVKEELWEAAQEYAQDQKDCDGEKYFLAAQAYAQDNPIIAYNLVCNAVGYSVRSGKKDTQKMIHFAHSLATKNNWSDIVEVLGWAVE